MYAETQENRKQWNREMLKTLLKQVELLSERSQKKEISCQELAILTDSMCALTNEIASQLDWLSVQSIRYGTL